VFVFKCDYCQKEFERDHRKSKDNKHNFCCQGCYGKWSSETGILRENMAGLRFGRLMVQNKYYLKKTAKSSNSYWGCICDCGSERWVMTAKLKNGNTKSCGCLRRDSLILPNNGACKGNKFREYKRNAENRFLVFSVTFDEFLKLADEPCYFCGAKPNNTVKSKSGVWTYNGIDRIDNSCGYTTQNCVPCCFICNRAKNKQSVDEFFQWIERVHLKHVSTLNKEHTIYSRESGREVYVQ